MSDHSYIMAEENDIQHGKTTTFITTVEKYLEDFLQAHKTVTKFLLGSCR